MIKLKLTNEELTKVNGGSIKLTVGTSLIIGGIVTFIIGAVKGLVSSTTCSLKK